jgi:hypothetical protein
MERTALVVVEDASDRGAIVQDHILRGVIRDGERMVLVDGLGHARFP